jgi:hypothetical protein
MVRRDSAAEGEVVVAVEEERDLDEPLVEFAGGMGVGRGLRVKKDGG